MNILGTQYSLSSKAFEIYVAGCSGKPHCDGCHNPESWDFNKGELFDDIYWSKIKSKIEEFNLLIDKVMLFGGEPLDQTHDELLNLLNKINKTNKEIWLFTRYEIEEVPDSIKNSCDFIKCGRYIEELKTDNNIQHGFKLATSNQKIYSL